MRVLLRNTHPGRHYQEPSKGKPEQGRAHDLENLPLALRVAVEAHLENVEVLLGFCSQFHKLVLLDYRRDFWLYDCERETRAARS